ncbi:hypothetical protein [Paraglaciecola psychrophila]|uniref:Nucleotide-diphospho-sugar transferase domain-containing protein n=1 Tax=Paraglaciecola psychrophila 170 TaxID=1129794 RepID=K7AUI0_9ALTE|nr:hypothetical protein [Paraglaciecola psychrophila]AGH43157.1 hypothetical protein C427_1048 [Paraglaciecola psychrophila 170]GAC38835.1 hypothetical protein GPSY_3224 [Paraglaciecola psychrophila 170]
MNILINFADENFRSKQKVNSYTAKHFGGFDEICEFTPNDIDSDFIKVNKDIFDQKRGFGYWLWKPYFILKVLEKSNEGDYIFYCDSGSFFVNNIDHLIKSMGKAKAEIMLFETPLIECQWTNQYLFDALNLNDDKYRLTNQISATYILIKKTNETVTFIKEYLSLCSNINFVTDKQKVKSKMVIDHRHDQSILSLLAKSKNIKPFKDPSDYGVYPFRYFTNDRLFRVNKYEEKYPVIVLSNRNVNPIMYYLKYWLRTIQSKLSRLSYINV